MPAGYDGTPGVAFGGAAGRFITADTVQQPAYLPAMVSPDGIIINEDGLPAELRSANGVTFDIAYMYAATLTGKAVTVTISGSLGGVETASLVVELLPGARPLLLDLSAFVGLDRVLFAPSDAASSEPGLNTTLFGLPPPTTPGSQRMQRRRRQTRRPAPHPRHPRAHLRLLHHCHHLCRRHRRLPARHHPRRPCPHLRHHPARHHPRRHTRHPVRQRCQASHSMTWRTCSWCLRATWAQQA